MLQSNSLARAAESNQVEWVAASGRLPGAALLRRDDAVAVLSACGPNHLCGMRFSPETVDGCLDDVLDGYRRLGVPAQLWLGPSSAPDDLEHRLRDRGIRCRKRMPIMAGLTERVGRKPASEGVEIVEVADHASFLGLEHPLFGDVTTAAKRRLLERVGQFRALEPDRMRLGVARVDGRPVGVGTVFLAAGVAGLYDIGVVEGQRRLGIGSALTSALLNMARELGARHATLLASGDGEALYRRLGFETVGTASQWYYSRSQQLRAAREVLK